MNLGVEQERSAFSDVEPITRRRKMLSKNSASRPSLSFSSSIDANDEIPEPFGAKREGGSKEAVGGGGGGGEVVGSCPLDQQHQGKKLLHVIVALPVDYIFSLIFVQEQVMMNVYQARKVTDVVNGRWQETQEPGQLSRQVTYAMAINVANFGSKTSYVTEIQTIQHSQTGQCYVVSTDAVNSGIPYGDSFSIFSHYCLIREPDSRTKITVWTQVKYKKQVWGVVKGMLERNSYNGVEAFEAELLSQITLIAERSERRGNRPPAVRPKTHSRTPSHGYKRQRSGAKDTLKDATSSSCNIWIVLSMVMAFVMLIVCNYFLYTKLNHLEHRSMRRVTIPPVSRYADGTTSSSFDGQQSSFLQHYQEIQGEQLQTWKSTVTEANRRLQQVQEALETVLANIKDNEEAMISVLQEFNSKAKLEEEARNHADEDGQLPLSPAGGEAS